MSLLSWLGQRIKLTHTKFWSTFLGGDTWAGEPVTLESALQIGAFYGCVRLYAQTQSTLPRTVYERLPDGTRKARPDHPLSRLISEEPNADQDACEFWEGMLAWQNARGNAFAEKIYRANDNQLIALNPLDPRFVSIERQPNGSKNFRYAPPGEPVRNLLEGKVFQLRDFNFGGDYGLSVLDLARQSLGITQATERSAGAHFANGMRPSGWLVYKGGTLEEDQRELARQNLINPMIGAGNTGKIGLLEGEFDYRQMTIPPENAQLLESRRFSVEDVCRWYGVPPILLSHASQGQTMWGSGIEQILLGWYVLQLRARIVKHDRALKRQLMTPEEKRTLYIETNADGLLRGDTAARWESYWKALQTGAMTPNQVCDKENLPRWVGGDRHFINTTLAPLDEDGIPIKASPEIGHNGGPPLDEDEEPQGQQPPPRPQQRRLEVVP